MELSPLKKLRHGLPLVACSCYDLQQRQHECCTPDMAAIHWLQAHLWLVKQHATGFGIELQQRC